MSAPNALTVGSLFAGIGGFDLGLERAGMVTRWQVELDPFCRRVLAKHWPDVTRHEDVREVGSHNLERVDVICGGFPCQDLSTAAHTERAGLDGGRSGLWAHMFRITYELRPRYVIVENVAVLRTRGLARVVGDLASVGYDSEWDTLSACAFGAPHTRRRLFLVAHPSRIGRKEGRRPEPPAESPESQRSGARRRWARPAESRPIGVAYGLPGRVDRTCALGNALVPQIAEWIGRRIVNYEAACNA